MNKLNIQAMLNLHKLHIFKHVLHEKNGRVFIMDDFGEIVFHFFNLWQQ